MEDSPALVGRLEDESKLEATRLFNTLVDHGGKPTRPLGPPPDDLGSQDGDQRVPLNCHWEAERRQFEGELRLWDNFLDRWPGWKGHDDVQKLLYERQPGNATADVERWQDYNLYEGIQIDNLRSWVETWQRQRNPFHNEEDRYRLEENADEVEKNRTHTEDARLYIEKAQSHLREAESTLA